MARNSGLMELGGNVKTSVQEGTKSFMNSVFTSDIYIRKANVPVFVMTCLMALAGSMLSGMYFAKQEARTVHAKERSELVNNFASIMKDNDEQIDRLTNALIVNQKAHTEKLDKIGETTTQLAIFVASNAAPSRIDKAKLERLEEHVEELKQAVDPLTPPAAQPSDPVK